MKDKHTKFSLTLRQFVLHETMVFSVYFFVYESLLSSWMLYIIFWPWGLLTFYDLGEGKAVFPSLFFIVLFCLELRRKQKSCSLMVQQVAT